MREDCFVEMYELTCGTVVTKNAAPIDKCIFHLDKMISHRDVVKGWICLEDGFILMEVNKEKEVDINEFTARLYLSRVNEYDEDDYDDIDF